MVISMGMRDVYRSEILPRRRNPFDEFVRGFGGQLRVYENGVSFSEDEGGTRGDPSEIILTWWSVASEALTLAEEGFMVEAWHFVSGSFLFSGVD